MSVSTAIPTCPISGLPMKPWLEFVGDYRRPKAGRPFRAFWCEQSGFGQIEPRPSPQDVPAFYDIPYYTHQAKESSQSQERTSFAARVRSHLAWRRDFGHQILSTDSLRTFLARPGARFLDLGCGSGAALVRAREAGAETVVGVEPDPAARETARGRGFVVHAGTAEEIPNQLEDERFDVVIMSHVLEHTLNPLVAAQELERLVAPGGVALIEVPNNEAIGLKVAGATWPWLDVPRHLNFFTKASLDAMIRKVGLVPERFEYRGYTRQFSTGWRSETQKIRGFLRARDPSWRLRIREPDELWLWGLLASTAFAPPSYKYDSVSVVARRPG